jgi:2-polyprenyl-3-methyl-5-hydroxy-6-metoxy-1,4-benzoquinol methylase
VPGVSFRRASSAELVAEGTAFDIVISNHLLHHLEEDALTTLLDDSARLATRLVVHNDIARSRLAYLAYAVASKPFGGQSFIHVDGLLSIRRSYRARELAARVSGPWSVRDQFPARLLLLADEPGLRHIGLNHTGLNRTGLNRTGRRPPEG